MKGRIVSAVMIAATLAGCASSASSIKPSYVAESVYDSWSCEKLQVEKQRVDTELARISSDQNENAAADAAMVGVGVVLFWPVLFGLIATDDYEDQIAQLKGYQHAVTQEVTERCSGESTT